MGHPVNADLYAQVLSPFIQFPGTLVGPWDSMQPQSLGSSIALPWECFCSSSACLPSCPLPSRDQKLRPTMKSLLLILHGKATTLLLPNRTKVLLGFPRPAVSCYMKSKQFQRKRLCLQRDWCKTTRRGKVFLEPKRTKKEPHSPSYCSLT